MGQVWNFTTDFDAGNHSQVVAQEHTAVRVASRKSQERGKAEKVPNRAGQGWGLVPLQCGPKCLDRRSAARMYGLARLGKTLFLARHVESSEALNTHDASPTIAGQTCSWKAQFCHFCSTWSHTRALQTRKGNECQCQEAKPLNETELSTNTGSPDAASAKTTPQGCNRSRVKLLTLHWLQVKSLAKKVDLLGVQSDLHCYIAFPH